jgi:hypothetical protein
MALVGGLAGGFLVTWRVPLLAGLEIFGGVGKRR